MADAVVVAAALVAQLEEGGERYFYQGEALSGVGEDEVKRLTEIGLVGEAKDIPDPTDPVTAPMTVREETRAPVKRAAPKS
jgi:hypothetical protein